MRDGTLIEDKIQSDINNIKKEIPTKTSDLINDSGYITSVPDEIYVGNDEMPESATIQILLDGSDEEQSLKDELKEYIDRELAKRGQLKPEFANDISECTDTSKLYVLPDGYIYAYTTITKIVEKYQNVADPTSSDWLINTRIGNSGLTTSDAKNYTTTNSIPCKTGDKIYVEGVTLTGNNCYIVFMNGSNVYLRANTNNVMNGTDTTGYFSYIKDGDIDIFTILSTAVGTYVRFCFFTPSNPEDIIISVNNPILPPEEVETQTWISTGIKFINVDFENPIVQNIIHEETRNNLSSIQLTPKFADSEEWLKANGDTSKIYIVDGYIWVWTQKEVVVEGSKSLVGAEYDGWTDGKRFNNSGSIVDEGVYAPSTITNLISCSTTAPNNVIYIKGAILRNNTDRIVAYADGTFLEA